MPEAGLLEREGTPLLEGYPALPWGPPLRLPLEALLAGKTCPDRAHYWNQSAGAIAGQAHLCTILFTNIPESIQLETSIDGSLTNPGDELGHE